MTVSDMESLAVQHVCSLESLLGHVWHDPYDSAVDSGVKALRTDSAVDDGVKALRTDSAVDGGIKALRPTAQFVTATGVVSRTVELSGPPEVVRKWTGGVGAVLTLLTLRQVPGLADRGGTGQSGQKQHRRRPQPQALRCPGTGRRLFAFPSPSAFARDLIQCCWPATSKAQQRPAAD